MTLIFVVYPAMTVHSDNRAVREDSRYVGTTGLELFPIVEPKKVIIEVVESEYMKAERLNAEQAAKARAIRPTVKTPQNPPITASSAAFRLPTNCKTVTLAGEQKTANIELARQKVIAKWGIGQWPAFEQLVNKESGFNHLRCNISTGRAYGIGQALPPTKMAAYGADWMTNPDTQLNWMIGYVEGRYGTPVAALTYHKLHGHY